MQINKNFHVSNVLYIQIIEGTSPSLSSTITIKTKHKNKHL